MDDFGKGNGSGGRAFRPLAGFSGLGIEKNRKKSRKSQNPNSERGFFKNLEKSAFTIWILIFSRFFADFLDAQSTKILEILKLREFKEES